MPVTTHNNRPVPTLTSHDTKMSSSPASATIPSLAAIYGSDTPPQDTKVSDVSVGNDDDDTSDDEEDDGSGNEGSDGEGGRRF